jgi:hypothetical protein
LSPVACDPFFLMRDSQSCKEQIRGIRLELGKPGRLVPEAVVAILDEGDLKVWELDTENFRKTGGSTRRAPQESNPLSLACAEFHDIGEKVRGGVAWRAAGSEQPTSQTDPRPIDINQVRSFQQLGGPWFILGLVGHGHIQIDEMSRSPRFESFLKAFKELGTSEPMDPDTEEIKTGFGEWIFPRHGAFHGRRSESRRVGLWGPPEKKEHKDQ